MRDLVDWSGLVKDHLDYSAYGVPTESNPSVGGRYGHAGREYNNNTQILDHRARPRKPAIGGWMREDPKGFGAGDPNLYRAMGNRPTVVVDPFGTDVLLISGSGYKSGRPNSSSAYYHYDVVVDVWKEGKGEHFWVDRKLYWFGGRGVGVMRTQSPSWFSMPFKLLWGDVQTASWKNTVILPPTTIRRIKTTPEQDIAIIRALEAKVTEQAAYGLFSRNCRWWASGVMDDIEQSLTRKGKKIYIRSAVDILNGSIQLLPVNDD